MQNAAERLVVLTGMSGAGKRLAARYFEDMGWRVVDNLPPRLLPNLALAGVETFRAGEGDRAPGLCVVCDVRAGQELSGLLPAAAALERGGLPPVLLFLEASDDALVRRFRETRRTHPLFLPYKGILPAIHAERALLGPIKERAGAVIDTTALSPADLRDGLLGLFGGGEERRQPLLVSVASFGFKHGLPLDADLVFDVRFLRNPHYVDDGAPLRRPPPACGGVRPGRRAHGLLSGAPVRSGGLVPAAVCRRGQGVPDGRYRLHGREAPVRGGGRKAGALLAGSGVPGADAAPRRGRL